MAETPRLTTYTFNVAMGDIDNPTFETVRTIGRDVQTAEQLFAKRGWGKTDSRPMTSAAAVAWAAMVRSGKFHGDFDSFESAYLEVSAEGQATATPTEPAPAPA